MTTLIYHSESDYKEALCQQNKEGKINCLEEHLVKVFNELRQLRGEPMTQDPSQLHQL
jgi:hypothetical protein